MGEGFTYGRGQSISKFYSIRFIDLKNELLNLFFILGISLSGLIHFVLTLVGLKNIVLGAAFVIKGLILSGFYYIKNWLKCLKMSLMIEPSSFK